MKIKDIVFLTFMFFLSGCLSHYPETPNGFVGKTIETKYLSFAVWEKEISIGKPLRIYIEGDGNPEPKKAIGLELAAQDPSQNVIYIARPCQYVNCPECKNPLIWGAERYNEELIDEMKDLIVYLSYKYKTPKLELVGYDGGAVIALTIATKIPVARVITIGGILDTYAYAEEHRLEPFNGINPATLKRTLARIPQTHYVGGKDTVTPRRLAERFVARLPNPKDAVVKIIPFATHTDWKAVPFDYYN